MRNVLYIAGKELRTYFVSPLAYVIMSLWLVALGIFFWLTLRDQHEATMRYVFQLVPLLLLFLSPFLTMRLIAEEARAGTLELLLTAPVQDWAVVVGKFLAAVVLYIVMNALTLFFPILMVLFNGNPDWGPIWSGYLGLTVMGMAFLSVGLLTSAMSSSQVVAAVISFVVLLVLYIMRELVSNAGPPLSDFLSQVSLYDRFDAFTRGIVDLKDVIFYLSFTAVVLFVSIQIVEARRYRS